LGDFFQMCHGDCLIRANSSLSRAAGAVGGHRFEILPRTWQDCDVDAEGVFEFQVKRRKDSNISN
jgi:hypothetical protein